ncbi:MAG TPA: hypothetical protein VIL64_02105 [Solirubrobacteraceae bacterium]|jgi:hypothetical protein
MLVRRIVLVLALAAGFLASVALGVSAQTTTPSGVGAAETPTVAGGDAVTSPSSSGGSVSVPASTTPSSTTTTTTGTSTTASSTPCPAAPSGAGGTTTTPTATTPATTTTTGLSNDTSCPKTPSISLGLQVPVSGLAPLHPGATATAKGSLEIVATTQSWTLLADDASNTGPDAGHLVREPGCDLGTAVLRHPLTMQASPVAGQSFGPASLSRSPIAVASGGEASQTVNLDFSQVIDADEAMVQGCHYGITVGITVS